MNKNKKWFGFLLLMMLGLAMVGTAVYADITATYTISKSVVAGGGHQNSTGGNYALSGTAGQSAAQTAVSGGDYSLASGFWAGDGDDYTATVQFNTDSYSVAEDGNSVEISVVRSGSSSGDVTVNYATSNGTATDGSDYTATSGTLTWYFTDGTSTKTFDIPIINDSAVENDETIMLTLSNPTSGATLGTNATATVTITDDDTSSAGKLQFTSATYSVAEDGGTVNVTIERIDGSSGAVSVNFVVSGGTATAGSDYTSPPQGIYSFPDGATQAVIPITIHDDSITEGDETIIMSLSNPTGGATLGTNATATVTITDDDTSSAGKLQFTSATYSVAEDGGTATIIVSRTDGSDGAVSVQYATVNGTATAGSDYTAVAGTLNFANGVTSQTFTVFITNDSVTEGDETVIMTLSNPSGGATLGTAVTVLTITEGGHKIYLPMITK